MSLLLPLLSPSAFVFCVFCLPPWRPVAVRDIYLPHNFPSISLTTRLRGQAKLPSKKWQQKAHASLPLDYHNIHRSRTSSYVVVRPEDLIFFAYTQLS